MKKSDNSVILTDVIISLCVRVLYNDKDFLKETVHDRTIADYVV